jgi:2-polyprenyl-6-methoxyphenol hydroxylase-like FAD-dependent oxidoreductase
MADDELHAQLRQRIAEYGGLIGRLREQVTDPRQVVYRPLETVLVPPPWHKGRVLIIGDAAHSGTPHLAQGAAMAIEDAVLLGEMLNQDRSLDATLHAFAARRLPRCRLVLEAGLQLGRWEMADWTGKSEPGTDHGGLLHSSLSALMQPA